ncbi:expressed unknown protein [Seminavis robusta]|uniref:F-box domain-containing protein n=1 Tax=Seminavis robusta TaxID=568900 RepID=A0A9N8EPX9_9STRA|nr:expressed unknown protein [Seminavis robusta]|eukprot:Sro1405_g269830.1 n/a (1144) ;mRNA; f:17764-21195
MADDMASLARMDSLEEYFMLNSPPESPQQPARKTAQAPPPNNNSWDAYGGAYFGGNEMASQGNVQLSTLNYSVDRSNAVGHRLLPSTQRDLDVILKMDDNSKELNLTELFLQSSHRSSLNSNYQAKGALKGHDNELHKKRSNSLSSSFLEDGTESANTNNNNNNNNNTNNTNTGVANSQTSPMNNNKPREGLSREPSLDFDLDVEPTPLSEIREKAEQRKFLREQHQQQPQGNSQGLTQQELDQHEYKLNRQHRLQHGSSYYPYGRSYQLPIPTMPPISPTQPNNTEQQQPLADPVATAAALASAQQTPVDNSGRSSGPPPHSPAPSHASSHASSSWHTNNQPHSRPESRNSTTSHGSYHHHRHSSSSHQSHSPSTAPQTAPPQAPPPIPYPPPHSYPPPQHHHTHHHTTTHHNHPGTTAPPQPPHHLTTPLASGHPPHPGHKIVGPYTTAQQEGNNAPLGNRRRTSAGNNSKSAPAPAPSYLPRRGEHMSREASAAHATPKGVLASATKQRRGYSGFHKPATSQTTNTYHHPLPSKFPNYTNTAPPSTNATSTTYVAAKKTIPPTITLAAAATTTTAAAATTKPAPKPASYANNGHLHRPPAPAPPPAVVTHNNNNHPQTADSAYERKKQRAKDARVKLNESIERLHVSMGLAGTESKKRAAQLRDFMKHAGRENESSTDHQAFELMDSCVKTAETAKKWDRPNFVGSAATMIQCLNSQCEILMKELLEYSSLDSSLGVVRPGRPAPPPLPEEQQQQQQSAPENGGKRSNENDTPEDPAAKRIRRDSVEEEKKEASGSATNVGSNSPVSPESATAMTVYSPSDGRPPFRLGDSVMGLIASFLDPGSLIQCMGVCKGWKDHERSFAKNATWVNVCIQRFGFSNVRQWQEKHAEDEEDDHDESGGTEENGQSGDFVENTGMKMYRAMDKQCIMPWLHDGKNLVLLGNARLPQVAAWMFLVDRSNKETMRSVKRNPNAESSSRQTGVYTSLPVVELRIVLQNTGGYHAKRGTSTGSTKNRAMTIVMNNQRLVVDASTRRRGEELLEIDWDDRFSKRILNPDGSNYVMRADSKQQSGDELAILNLFDTVVVDAFIHARRCSTTTKFRHRSKFLTILVTVNGTTQPLVIPFADNPQGASVGSFSSHS